ncbi:hypothetical protein DM02DRAFT_653164 [Periconia macrospinosa]|uniref:Uncharacterized protein n=1 Tax=Periconia macrospinosa TaxID=97972 RepID=A0A2V1DXF3_9PLEO|nr:hypothetical protein DM02DRAFT_653164 [Periconia macrospinosa]
MPPLNTTNPTVPSIFPVGSPESNLQNLSIGVTAILLAVATLGVAILQLNLDPTEEPIMLLGSVFDVNLFGKWDYD